MNMTIDEAFRRILAAVITIKVMEIADKEAGDVPVYQLLRPLLLSSLLYSAYQSIRVDSRGRKGRGMPSRPPVVGNRVVKG